MRGEEHVLHKCREHELELPPHARRRGLAKRCRSLCGGITSACAEKSYRRARGSCRPRNYLRMRGEERSRAPNFIGWQELPPHARRRASTVPILRRLNGITSACAEKRNILTAAQASLKNYLRMRGEEVPSRAQLKRVTELPPHARRRAAASGVFGSYVGITSACAEKRILRIARLQHQRNYLRMRGEEAGCKRIVFGS